MNTSIKVKELHHLITLKDKMEDDNWFNVGRIWFSFIIMKNSKKIKSSIQLVLFYGLK